MIAIFILEMSNVAIEKESKLNSLIFQFNLLICNKQNFWFFLLYYQLIRLHYEFFRLHYEFFPLSHAFQTFIERHSWGIYFKRNSCWKDYYWWIFTFSSFMKFMPILPSNINEVDINNIFILLCWWENKCEMREQ